MKNERMYQEESALKNMNIVRQKILWM